MKNLQRTPLYGWHVGNGAKMAPFGGWEMPLSYGSEIKEWRAVREAAGLFDVSHMTILSISGTCTEMFVQQVTTNDVRRLNVGEVQYTLLCNENGGILDDVTVYKSLYGVFYFVVNANNAVKIHEWLLAVNRTRHFHVDIINHKHETLFALQGPCARDILVNIAIEIPDKRYSFIRSPHSDKQPLLVSRTGYTGEDGFEIFCENSKAQELWELILSAGKSFGLLPCGLVARDMLRTEAGMRLYGNDITETTNPIEAGLEKYVSLEKADFIGKTAIEAALSLRNRGGGIFFHGFVMDRKFSPQHGTGIFIGAEVSIPDEFGVVTSATYSPHLKKRILMGYTREKKNPGDIVWVRLGEEKSGPATVTALPFYSRKKKDA